MSDADVTVEVEADKLSAYLTVARTTESAELTAAKIRLALGGTR